MSNEEKVDPLELKRATQKEVDEKNALALGQALENQTLVIEELREQMAQLQTQVTLFQQELANQKSLIVRSLQSKFAGGSTS